MKIILSRKGFDSASGGVPSPIFPDGSIVSLPIPDKNAPLTYREISGCPSASLGELVEQLAGRPAFHRAHLDPDLRYESIPRDAGWRPLFGQAAAAAGHLKNQGVGEGDIFLFYGLFQQVEQVGGLWRYVKGSRKLHAIFGWLQVAACHAVSAWPAKDLWARSHPHYGRSGLANDTLYVAAERLTLPGAASIEIPGAGVFSCLTKKRTLTDIDAAQHGIWRLPLWFHPEGRESALTYHGNPSRWKRQQDEALLSSVSRGQEFVLDGDHYPEAASWIAELFSERDIPCPPR